MDSFGLRSINKEYLLAKNVSAAEFGQFLDDFCTNIGNTEIVADCNSINNRL